MNGTTVREMAQILCAKDKIIFPIVENLRFIFFTLNYLNISFIQAAQYWIEFGSVHNKHVECDEITRREGVLLSLDILWKISLGFPRFLYTRKDLRSVASRIECFCFLCNTVIIFLMIMYSDLAVENH